MMTAKVKNANDEPVEVKVGDWVGFKSDYEQSGKITKIERHHSKGWNLTLENESGFGGEYLRYATTTVEHSDDCWAE